MPLRLQTDFAVKIADSLGWKVQQVLDNFEFDEDKQGLFWAKLKPKHHLEKHEFRTMCALTRDLGGEAYVLGAQAWNVPGPMAKKSPTAPEKTPLGSPGTTEKAGVGSKTEPVQGITFAFLPLTALVSMPFQLRHDQDDPDLKDLAKSLETYGILEPIVVRQKQSGLYEVTMGERRVKAAKKAGLVEVPAMIRGLSDEEAAVCQLIENIHRKDLSDQEKSRALAELAKTKKWNAQQLAEHLSMSYTWVVKYLPAEFKSEEKAEAGKAGGEAKAEASRESQDFATRRVAESQDTRKAQVPCAGCGTPTSEPFHAPDSQFYCDEECYLQTKAERQRGLGSEGKEEHGDLSSESSKTEKEAVSKTPPKPEPLLTGYPWTCPDCGMKFIINHIDFPDSSKKEHRLEACG